jgi:RNA polymerase sigma factor CnrH
MADEPDGDLLRRFVQGDRDAFEWLFTRFHAEVHRWSQRIVRDATAADDVVVESFWRAYRGRARFDPSRSFGAWMRGIATNVARDHLRVMRVQPASLESEPAMPLASPIDGSAGRAAISGRESSTASTPGRRCRGSISVSLLSWLLRC